MNIIKKSIISINSLKQLWDLLCTKKLFEKLKGNERGIFIDCGAYDGCSAIKFLISNPHFDCISFEPNPALWHYFASVPTTLIKKGAGIKKGKTKFYIDHIDGDGSSAIPKKNIIFGNPGKNKDCPVIHIETVSIPDLICKLSKKYKKIILKLDVEGLEYEILAKMVSTQTIRKIEKIYAEFHWEKCGVSEQHHLKILNSSQQFVTIKGWDGSNFAIHQQGNEKKYWRSQLVKKRLGDISKYQKLKIDHILK